jgi:serine/threonine protein kinase
VFVNNASNVYLQGNPKLCSNTGCGNSHDGGKRKLIVIVVAVTSVTIVAFCLASYLLLYMKKTKVRDVEGSSTTFKGEHRMVTYDELRLGTQNFNRENLIGQGSFGSVFKGYISEGFEVAVKVFDIDRTGYWKSFVAECEALRHVRHRNLVKLITSCSSMDSKNNQFLALVYEYMINGSLDDWIRGNRKGQNGEGLNILQRLNVAIDIASALNYLHHDCNDPIVHCDLKPSNVLLSDDMTAKVGDFGLARLLIESNNDQSSSNVLKGSIGYIPPEYGMGAKPAITGDVYSFGIMLMELFTGKSPTDESFVGGLTLNSWVQEEFSTEIKQVIDPELLLQVNNTCHDGDKINPMIQLNGLATILGVGLSCTAESPEGRMNMNDALRKLKGVETLFL